MTAPVATREQQAVAERYALEYGEVELWMFEQRAIAPLAYLTCPDGTFVYDQDGRPLNSADDNPALPLAALTQEGVLI